MALKLSFESKSDVGLERSENQDFFGSYLGDDASFYIVCDGMGGHAGGSTASRVGVMTIEEKLKERVDLSVPDRVVHAIESANSAIFAMARNKPTLRGMGTTVVMVAVEHDTQLAWMAHVGDSRGYLLRGEEFHRLTRDHTMVQRLVDDGILSEEDAENHPNANIISRSLGSRDSVEVELCAEPIAVQNGDMFLLCSDGLYGLVSEQEMGETTASQPPADAVVRLVQRACEEGGHDNITVEIVVVGDQPAAAPNIRVIKPAPLRPPEPEAAAPASPEAAVAAAPMTTTPVEPAPRRSGSSILWLLIILVVIAATIVAAYRIAFSTLGTDATASPNQAAESADQVPTLSNPPGASEVTAPNDNPPPPRPTRWPLKPPALRISAKLNHAWTQSRQR